MEQQPPTSVISAAKIVSDIVDENAAPPSHTTVAAAANFHREIKDDPEDLRVGDQRYAVVSASSVTGGSVRRPTCAIKVHGCFADIEEARQHMRRLAKHDNTFDIYIIECGKWAPVPPPPLPLGATAGTQTIEYSNPEMQKLMEPHMRRVQQENDAMQARMNALKAKNKKTRRQLNKQRSAAMERNRADSMRTSRRVAAAEVRSNQEKKNAPLTEKSGPVATLSSPATPAPE